MVLHILAEQEEDGSFNGAKGYDGNDFGGVGGSGNGVAISGWSWGAGGGAGNPGGIGVGNNVQNGANGTGGLLVIFANEFSNQSIISSNGSKGGSAYRAGAGGSGGGSINIFYNTNTSNTTSSITATGGARGVGTRSRGETISGGAGGNGSITKGKISNGIFVKE